MMHRVVSHFIRTTGRRSHYLAIHSSGCSAELVMSCFGLNVGTHVCAHANREGGHTVFIRGTKTSTPGQCNERSPPPRIFKFHSDPPLIGHRSSGRLFQPGALTPRQLATSINLAFNNPSLIKAPAVGAAVACV